MEPERAVGNRSLVWFDGAPPGRVPEPLISTNTGASIIGGQASRSAVEFGGAQHPEPIADVALGARWSGIPEPGHLATGVLPDGATGARSVNVSTTYR